MENTFLTIKEAGELAGRSEITIRRLIKHLLKSPTDETTQMIKQERQSDNPQSPFIYRVSSELIRRSFNLPTHETTQVNTQEQPVDYTPTNQVPTQTTTQEQEVSNQPQETPTQMLREVVDLLKDQVRIKDTQIEGLSKTVDQLIERDRETNIILKGLQDRLYLLEAPEKPKPDITAQVGKSEAQRGE
jgi:hypothetical protein